MTTNPPTHRHILLASYFAKNTTYEGRKKPKEEEFEVPYQYLSDQLRYILYGRKPLYSIR